MQYPAFAFLLETTLKSTAILSGTWCVLVLLRGKSAAVRHFIWCLAFAGMLALPILSTALPALSVPVARAFAAPDFVFQTSAHVPRHYQDDQGRSLPAPLLNASPRLPDWRLLVMLLWAAGAAVSFGQMLIGWASVHRLRRQSRVFAAPSFAALAKLIKVEGSVELLKTESETMPMTYGVFRPAIFLPLDASEWSEERRQMVVLHELAHVRRGDGATHLMARTVVSLYWWNPLVWSAWREFLKERERAADDLVLSVGAGRPEYAGHLLEIARSLHSLPPHRWPVIAMASRSQLEGRLSSILDSGRDRKKPGRGAILGGAFAALAVIGPLAALQARSDQATKAGVSLCELSQETQTAMNALRFVQAGDLAREQGKLSQARDSYTKALNTEPNQPIALIHRGTVELETKDFPAALGDFEQARKSDSRYAGEALMWQAITQERDNKPDAAEQFYQRALAASDMHSIATATTMDLYSQLLQQQGKADQATLMQTQAAAIRAAQAQAPVSSAAYHAGKNVSSPVLKLKLEPEYSAEARAAKYEGTVLLRTEIGADGQVHDIHVIRALGLGLDDKAVAAVSKWKFQPGMVDGRPVSVVANIEVKFRLN